MTDAGVISFPLPDAPARARIVSDLDTNLLVEAGAGSGKTTALVARMVALVATGTAEVDQIAAVTFTRKAAAELRERFQARLEERIREVADRAAAEDAVPGRLRQALEDIDRSFVGTVHAFCARLLRERPLEVGLDPAFEELPVEERLVLRRTFWDAYLERLTRDSDPLLEELAAAGLRPARLMGMFGQVVENPDVDFTATEVERPTVPPRMHEELEAIVERGMELMPERPPSKNWDSLQKKIRTLHFMREVTGWGEATQLFDAIAALWKPGPKGHNVTQNRWKDGALAKQLCARVNAFAVGDSEAARLLAAWYAHRYALAVRLVGRAAEEFEAHRIRMGRLDFQDLLVLSARLLRSNPDVRRQLGARYRRILVDEFQDTDPLQAEIMLLLASEPATGDKGQENAAGSEWTSVEPRPGALFVVGDPKQSIYRFRRADILLYARVKERFARFGAVLELTANFRSLPTIGDLVNGVFNAPEFFPEAATPEQAAFEPLNTRPAASLPVKEGVFTYDVTPDAANREALAAADAEALASWIRQRVDAGERGPGDFLILTRTRQQIDKYARSIEKRGLPVEVTGAGVGVEAELRELRVLLECLIDPTHPVKVVAALVGLFFGLDYEQLLAHRLEGGSFDAMRPGDAGHTAVKEALGVLHAWWRTATREPADVLIASLVSELGLLPFAAAGELGAVRAGALAYALDTVRASALAGDASLPGVLRALDSALDLTEAEAPLEPGRPGTVRLMNLHQAKGLEAPVVVLAEPHGTVDRDPELHVERPDVGRARGFARVVEAREGFGGATMLAKPSDWAAKAELEKAFEAAEEIRLLYVAVTRAREELVVARWPEKPSKSPWSPLDPWLDAHAERIAMEIVPPTPRAALEVEWADEAARASAAAEARLASLAHPTYEHVTVTDLAKGADAGGAWRQDPPAAGGTSSTPGASAPRSAGSAPAPGPPAASTDAATHPGFRGFSWGTVVHAALADTAGAEGDDTLRAMCRALLVEHERPVDDHGEPLELVELIDLVRAVRASDVWARARRAEQLLTEVPFALPMVGDREPVDAPEPPASPARGGGEKRQLDLFGESGSVADVGEEGGRAPAVPRPVAVGGPGPEDGSGRGARAADREGRSDRGEAPRQVLEGVVDLVFREPEGWVVVDYKTDLGTDPTFPIRREAYRRQVELYADAWGRLTGEPVKERILFFTAQRRVEGW